MKPFDQYASEYSAVLAKNLRFIPGGTDYYNHNRVRITKRVIKNTPLPSPKRILDFGGGIGLSIPHLKAEFPAADISICDASSESVKVAHKAHPDIEVLDPHGLHANYFDLIFVAGVVHHVQPSHRMELLARIINSLAVGGTLILHELNPLNPVTRRLVACCPFDDDAILISKAELIRSLDSLEGVRLIHEGFSVFLPPLLHPLSRIERLLSWCPLGAQYFVALTRTRS